MKITTMKQSALFILFAITLGSSYQAYAKDNQVVEYAGGQGNTALVPATADGQLSHVIPDKTKVIAATIVKSKIDYSESKALLLTVFTKMEALGKPSKVPMWAKKQIKTALQEIDACIIKLCETNELPEWLTQELQEAWVEIKRALASTKGMAIKKIEPHLTAITKKFIDKFDQLIEKLSQEPGGEELVDFLVEKFEEVKKQLPGGPNAKLNAAQKLSLATALRWGIA